MTSPPSPPPPLFLASSSPRRRELLQAAGYAPRWLEAPVAESHAPFLTAPELVLLNARRKGRAALAAHRASLPKTGAVIVAADTLVCLEGAALGKPRDLPEAHAMLARLAGRTHQVYTGVALFRVSLKNTRDFSFVERTDVTFRPLAAAAIRAYLARIHPLDKAGGYAAQEHGSAIIAAWSGSWTNVLGLPMETLAGALAALGVRPRPAAP